jgi:hypothetical protein
MKNNALFAVILIGLFLYMVNADTKEITIINESPDVSTDDLIDADVSFTGLDKYNSGTALTDELVRVFRINDARKDLGTYSLDSGALNVKPGTDYKFYFFMNTTGPTVDYYVDVQEYTGKSQEATDNIVGMGCNIDTNPRITVRNSGGSIQTASANAEAISANGANVDLELTVASHQDECYGNPGAPKGNAMCFSYNANAISNLHTNTKWITVPRSVSSLDQTTVKCYEFALLEDGASQTLTLTLEPGSTEPTIAHNISIFLDDIAFDIHDTTLNEIWGYTDEDGNQLSHIIDSTADGTVYIS